MAEHKLTEEALETLRAESPRMFRSMYPDGTRPLVGASRNMLGARLPDPNSKDRHDVAPDPAGSVHPGQGGMSVSRELREMPGFLIPARLKEPLRIRSARGDSALRVWRLGSGPFASASLTADLRLSLDHAGGTHGVVEPAQPMQVQEYQDALASTRESWELEEL